MRHEHPKTLDSCLSRWHSPSPSYPTHPWPRGDLCPPWLRLDGCSVLLLSPFFVTHHTSFRVPPRTLCPSLFPLCTIITTHHLLRLWPGWPLFCFYVLLHRGARRTAQARLVLSFDSSRFCSAQQYVPAHWPCCCVAASLCSHGPRSATYSPPPRLPGAPAPHSLSALRLAYGGHASPGPDRLSKCVCLGLCVCLPGRDALLDSVGVPGRVSRPCLPP